jgi:two-component sensor histidine kinase
MRTQETGNHTHEADAEMPSRPDSASAARAFLSRLLDGWEIDAKVIDDAALLTGELMTNAVRHGSGAVTLRIEAKNGLVHVAVHDDEQALTDSERDGGSRLSSSGQWIVESVAHEWGTDKSDGCSGKTMWFELKAPGIEPS